MQRGSNGENGSVDVVYSAQLDDGYVPPAEFASRCEEQGIKRYSYDCAELEFVASE